MNVETKSVAEFSIVLSEEEAQALYDEMDDPDTSDTLISNGMIVNIRREIGAYFGNKYKR